MKDTIHTLCGLDVAAKCARQQIFHPVRRLRRLRSDITFVGRGAFCMKFQDLTGQKFNRLIVVEQVGSTRKPKWICLCDCGATTTALSYQLKNGSKASCGCARKKHGQYGTKLYRTWSAILTRCLNTNCRHWHRYGGRGITLHQDWRSFENFARDVGNPPTEKHTIDRINNDGNYEPGNVRWVTRLDQGRNRSTNVLITANGETHCVQEWAEILNIPATSIYGRVSRGLSNQDALFLK